MSEQIFHTTLEPHPYLSITPTLFSGRKPDRHRNPSKDQVVYEEEPNVIVTLPGACYQTPSTLTPPIKRDPGPHGYHKIVKLSVGYNKIS